MAGSSIEDAHTAQRSATKRTDAQANKSLPVTSANVVTTDSVASTTKTSPDSIVIGGVTYYPSPATQASSACMAVSTTARIETLGSVSDGSSADSLQSFSSYLALSGPVKASK